MEEPQFFLCFKRWHVNYRFLSFFSIVSPYNAVVFPCRASLLTWIPLLRRELQHCFIADVTSIKGLVN